MKAAASHTLFAAMVFVVLAIPLTAGFQRPAAATTSTVIPVPIVFASRNHMDNLDGRYVGPPIEVLGREKAPGGKLTVLYPDGRLVDITQGKLFDVSRPAASLDGERIVFSGVRNAKDQWHIYEVNLDGSDLRQLTFDDRSIPVLLDPSIPAQIRNQFKRYGDFSPAYLPDGRIVFSSSRYPSLSGSCGQRALNLYVMNGDGSDMHRITTERSGAIDPYVLSSGRIVFSHWVDNMNTLSSHGPGLRPLEAERSFGPSFWIFWATHPDGTSAGRYAFDGGKFTDKGGVFQPREMPDGRIVYTYRAEGNLLGSTLATSIAILTPGAGAGNSVQGIGDPSNLNAPHALSPAPLPDGRILFSYTPTASVQTDHDGKTTAQFNFGLYVTDDKFGSPVLVHDDPDRDELDAVAIYPRGAQVLPDLPGASMISDDPTADLGGTATLHNSNIYADLPVEFREILSPQPGSVVAVDFYDDSQTFSTSDQFPLLRKQPPKFLGSVPVAPDGSFTAKVPADKPIFWLLRTASGQTERTVTAPPVVTYPSFVPTHDYFRPGQQAECIGCHRGHMINQDITFEKAATNLARLATASASSSLDSNYSASWRVNDSRLSDSKGHYDWASAGEKTPWVQLGWLAPVGVDEVVLYPRTASGNLVNRATLYVSDGTSIPIVAPLTGPESLTVPVKKQQVYWLRFQIDASQGSSPGLAEMVVHGPSTSPVADLPPGAPRGLKATDESIQLTWTRNVEPYLMGYKVYYGTTSGKYDHVVDVGNVDRYVMTALQDGVTYYVALKAYNEQARESPGFSAEVKATYYAPTLTGVSPAAGPSFGDAEVTIKGTHFARGSTVLIGGSHAKVESATSDTMKVLTPHRKIGPADVLVIRPDGARASLPVGTYSFVAR